MESIMIRYTRIILFKRIRILSKL